MKIQLFNVWKEFRFDAAHQLDAGPDGDPRYRRLHGHSYQVEAWVRGPRTQYGWVVDMGDLERRLDAIHAKLDHRFLKEIEEMGRSEERRVGKGGVSTGRSRWSLYHEQKNTRNHEKIQIIIEER